MGGAVPQSPPIGTFKPGGEDAVKEWIDDDRIANGIKPRYRPLAAAFDTPPVLRANANAPATPADPDPNNLLEYGQNYGYLGDETPPQQIAQAPAPQPPPAPAPPRAVHTPNAPVPDAPEERFPNPGGLRETPEQRRQRIENQQAWEAQMQDLRSQTVIGQTPEERAQDQVPQWRMPVQGAQFREADAQGEGHFGARRNRTPVEGANPRRFGYLEGHAGVDIAAQPGAAVVSPVDGTIREIRQNPNGGGDVMIETQSGHRFVLRYNHSGLDLRRGAEVTAGQTAIGTVGDNLLRYPNARGITNHLHMEVERHGRRLNPHGALQRE
jgi:murein DD-endopeptidase MepM/ murein hydrolase activator NlpD